MAISTTKPQIFRFERTDSGITRIHVCWDINEISKIDEDGSSYTYWEYKEWHIEWIVPPTYIKDGVLITTRVENADGTTNKAATIVNIMEYININSVEILGYSKDAYYLKRL